MPGPKSDKIWADAVRRAVNRRLENEEGKPKKIERLADNLVDLGLAGESWAVQEIGNRLDGRPHQSSDVNAKVDTGDALTSLMQRIGQQPKRISDD